MRAKELLREYNSKQTVKQLGVELITALYRTPKTLVPKELQDYYTLLQMSSRLNRDRLDLKSISPKQTLDLGGKKTVVTVDNANQILKQVAPKIARDILKVIESRDPTKDKKYTLWLAQMYANDPSFRLNDFDRFKMLNYIDRAKSYNIINSQFDISRFDTYRDFEQWFLRQDIIKQIEQHEFNQFKQQFTKN